MWGGQGDVGEASWGVGRDGLFAWHSAQYVSTLWQFRPRKCSNYMRNRYCVNQDLVPAAAVALLLSSNGGDGAFARLPLPLPACAAAARRSCSLACVTPRRRAAMPSKW